jgi:hypothetical protein
LIYKFFVDLHKIFCYIKYTSWAEAGSGGVQPAKDPNWCFILPLTGRLGIALDLKACPAIFFSNLTHIFTLKGQVKLETLKNSIFRPDVLIHWLCSESKHPEAGLN